MDGSDPENVTLKMIQALELVPIVDIEIKVIAGVTNLNLGMLRKVSLSLSCKGYGSLLT
jgi:spore coat polysaccharide biosynthesis predicted glycosyltransferase SpsG